MDELAHIAQNEVVKEVFDDGEEMTDEEWKQIQGSRKHYWLYQYQFKKGNRANPGGKPKGMTMKHFAREYLGRMTLKERIAFMSTIDPYDIWRMAEGNPSEDKNIQITVPRPILGGITQGNEALEGSTSPANEESGTFLPLEPAHEPYMQGEGQEGGKEKA